MIEIFFKLKSEYNFYFICNICNNFELHSKKLPILTTEEGEVCKTSNIDQQKRNRGHALYDFDYRYVSADL